MAIKAIRKNKSPPVFSHEFVIQNHADIVSSFSMIFLLGLMFQSTNPLASTFVLFSYNTTQGQVDSTTKEAQPILYSIGLKDIAVTFFYALICIVIHAVIQEYAIDKITKKLHLSKTKNSRFNESGQLFSFSAICAAWGLHLIFYQNIFSGISSLWVGYPDEHAMPFQLKMFYITQLAYWIHTVPELYFQKVKKIEWMNKLIEPACYFTFVFAAYVLRFYRVGLILLVLRFIDEAVLQMCKLLSFAEKTQWAETGFRAWNGLFVGCRLVSFIVAILTFHYGLATLDERAFDAAAGNFNSQFVRFNSLAAVCLVQAWMMWNFIHFHLRRSKERQGQTAAAVSTPPKTKSKKKDRSKRVNEDDVSMLPEADQNSRRRK